MEKHQVPFDLIASVRKTSPLVYQITNFVTVNDCANITLAIGASPVMTLAIEEAADMASYASAVVLNMGTPDAQGIASMLAAGAVARAKGTPVVFDPVGAGATPYRQALARRIMEEIRPTIVKGNLAEIRFLAGMDSAQRGVDSLDDQGAAEACLALARLYGCVAFATGARDCISDGVNTWNIAGGCALLGQVCGTGCMTAALCGAFAASGCSPLHAALAASVSMKKAGEIAATACGSPPAQTIPSGPGQRGPVGLGRFRIALHDAMCGLLDQDLDFAARLSHAQI